MMNKFEKVRHEEENRIEKALSMPLPWAWSELQQMDPEPKDLAYVAELVPRGSRAHKIYADRVNHDMGDEENHPRGVYYRTLISMLAVAIYAF